LKRTKKIKMGKPALITIFLLLITATLASAQTEMADTMRSNGKIYVVVMVLATIFAGIFAYLIILDRKISGIEKEKKFNSHIK
jgi:heme export protein D (CcmD)